MQPQQQTIVTDSGVIPIQPVYVTQPYQSSGVVQQYRHRQATISGILLIISGSLSIVFNIVDLAVGTRRSTDHLYDYYYGSVYYYDYEYLSSRSNGVSGHGIWCGVLFIIAGIFGIIAGCQKNRCTITTFLVFAIFGAVFAAIQVIISAIGASNVHDHYNQHNDTPATVFAMAVLMAIAGVCAFGFSLWGSIICCITGDCCTPQPTVFAMMPVGHPQVTVVSQQQQQPMQPVSMAQPPAYSNTAFYPPQYPVPAYDNKHLTSNSP